MKQYLYQEKNGNLKATRYKPSYSDDEYTGFGHYYDKKTGQWLSGVAVFADDFSGALNWTAYSGTESVSLTGDNKLFVERNSGAAQTSYRDITTVVGKKYRIIVDVTSSTNTGDVYVDNTTYTEQYGASGAVSGGTTINFTFTAGDTTSRVSLGATGSTTAKTTYDNFSIIPLNDDGTIDTSNGTPVSPEITYTGEVVEVDTQGNPLYSDKFDVPTLQEEYIVADKVKADTVNVTNDITINGSGMIGHNQTWQDMTAFRDQAVTYTNDTGRPIFVSFMITGSSSAVARLVIDGITVSTINCANVWATVSGIVPAGSTYRGYQNGTLAGYYVYELR